MKKLLVKYEFIIQEFSQAIEAVEAIEAKPESWTKILDDGSIETLLEQPKLEDGTNDESYTYHEPIQAVNGIEGKPEVPEIREIKIIDQTEGPEEELHIWLSGNIFKYPEGYFVEWIDLTDEYNKKIAIEEKIAIGKKAKEACENVLALISGYNLNRELTIEQISLMQTSFAQIEKALQSGRPSLAKAYISQIEPDEILVTSEMKEMAIFLLGDY